jgi:hypothetical protein
MHARSFWAFRTGHGTSGMVGRKGLNDFCFDVAFVTAAGSPRNYARKYSLRGQLLIEKWGTFRSQICRRKPEMHAPLEWS